jgi:hypothetical protein
MEKDKRELLDTYRKLDPENRANVLSHALTAYIAQENTKKHIFRLLNSGGPAYGFPEARPEVPPVRARRGSTDPVLAQGGGYDNALQGKRG